MRRQRNHGLVDRDTVEGFGLVSRMDTLQAAVLEFRLGRLDEIIRQRRANAARYRELLDCGEIYIAPDRNIEFNTYHTFVIQLERRDALQRYLAEKGIGTAIHYPIPIHLQPAAAALGYLRGDFPIAKSQAERILTLPINPSLTVQQIEIIATETKRFLGLRS